MTDERITREVTPLVEVLAATVGTTGHRLIARTEHGALFDEDGRAVFEVPAPGGRPTRILVDADVDLYEQVMGMEPDRIERCFEVHAAEVPDPLPARLRGTTVVVPWSAGALVVPRDAAVAVRVEPGQTAIPREACAAHVTLRHGLPEAWPTGAPTLATLPVTSAESMDCLPQLFHGMGTARNPVREVRLRIDPRVFRLKDRRAPFLSEVVEALANACGCTTSQLQRELTLRRRLLPLGLRRHLLPDPYFVTWIFRGHRLRGLVPATDGFPVPRRPSRQEMLRGTPESEHERLQAYLAFLSDPRPRLEALEARELFAISVHYLPNEDLPLYPNLGGIGRWDGRTLVPLG